MKKIEKTEEEWQDELTDEQYHVCRQKGTEPPFTGKYHDSKDSGIYRCVCCGSELFESETKFDSGTGWPSFYQPISEETVGTEEDSNHGMRRTEVVCKACGAHLGPRLSRRATADRTPLLHQFRFSGSRQERIRTIAESRRTQRTRTGLYSLISLRLCVSALRSSRLL